MGRHPFAVLLSRRDACLQLLELVLSVDGHEAPELVEPVLHQDDLSAVGRPVRSRAFLEHE